MAISISKPAPPDASGTLMQRAKHTRVTAFQKARLRVTEVEGSDTLVGYVAGYTRPVTEVLADVAHFSSLIVDKVVGLRELGLSIAHNRLVLTGHSKMFEFTPSFFNSFARFVNTHTHISSLAGNFLASMHKQTTQECLHTLEALINYAMHQLAIRYHTSAGVPKLVKLRALKPDSTGVWPSQWSARAMLHSDYRDDISHLWLMGLLSSICDDGAVSDSYFDGNLMSGALLLPDIKRVENDSEYGGGLYYFSGEVGNRRAGVMPFVFRTANRAVSVCSQSWNVSHVATQNVDKLDSSLRSFVHGQIPLIDEALNRLLALRSVVFDMKSDRALERLCIALASFFRTVLSNRDIRLLAVSVAVEKQLDASVALSAFTVQNAMTRVARAATDPVRRITLDQVSGKLIELDWEKVGRVASAVTDAQVSKIFKEN